MSDRAARLAALRAKAGKSKPAPSATVDEPKQMKFRNYEPPPSEVAEGDDATVDDDLEQASKRVKTSNGEEKTVMQKALEEVNVANVGASAQSLNSMTPKKSNWDLKRDCASKLKKLDRKTKKALVALLREKIEREEQEESEEEEDGDLD
ncbi:hypothetical protein TL16_g08109 [Triparma laevis f. inornata]|uniref:Coiled-coil domain-containing protein 12 n=2 Tax=Triparma laevis TaxID=1534972 RepID=A0A9W7F7Q8_9STRA|nr:hypothetical protein TL16_g08109 [Triparma laevis f. inornata]GMI06414.1 hypothetical protein TrLO_g3742 [Triparma laevis f. longispina]